YVDKNIDLIKIWGFFFPSINFLASLSIAIFYLFGLKEIILTKISIGEGLMFISYLNMVVWPMIGIGFAFNMLSRGIASTKRIIILMNTKPDFEDAKENIDIKIKGEIEIKNLTFSYDEKGKEVLKDINDIKIGIIDLDIQNSSQLNISASLSQILKEYNKKISI
ncbi:MAG: hypothetical protein WH035_01970, partial [Spirochaetota bacterium]